MARQTTVDQPRLLFGVDRDSTMHNPPPPPTHTYVVGKRQSTRNLPTVALYSLTATEKKQLATSTINTTMSMRNPSHLAVYTHPKYARVFMSTRSVKSFRNRSG